MTTGGALLTVTWSGTSVEPPFGSENVRVTSETAGPSGVVQVHHQSKPPSSVGPAP